MNVCTKNFPNALCIGCFFHYKKDLIKNIKLYGLYKKKDKQMSDNIIKELGILPIYYNGNIEYIDNKLNELKNNNPKYVNFIDNYNCLNKFF